MSLNWDISDCANSEELLTEEQWPMTEFMIFSTMIVGIGKITEENVSEYYSRIRFYERLNGHFFKTKDEFGNFEGKDFPPSELKKYIGLRANVSYEETEGWISRISEGTLQKEKHFYEDAE